MFRFEQPDILHLLWLIPILALLVWVAWRQKEKRRERFAEEHLLPRMNPDHSPTKTWLKTALILAALACLIIAWANPQWGIKKEKVQRESADIFIALDISQSMMAEDIQPNRLDRARYFAQQLIEGLKGERIGVIVFAGNAYMQMPLSTDYAAAVLFVRSANPGQAPTQGTAIGEAIRLAEKSFDNKETNHRALIIISDGEDHEDETFQIAEEASAAGLIICTVGVGTEQGGYIPVTRGGRADYKRDDSGQPVRSVFNPAMLQDLADQGNGLYFNIREGNQVIGELRERIDALEKREFEQRVFSKYESYYHYFIGLALFFLLLEFFIKDRKNKRLAGKKWLRI